MTAEILLQTLASGVLIGLIYALVAVGLTLIFGVMDIVNFSHGEFLMLGMYGAFWMYALLALDPIWSLPITAIGLFFIGAVLTTLAVYLFLTRTKAGSALEATAADREAAQLMGIDSRRMFTLAWGLGAACAGVAGGLLATFFPIFPEVGANFVLIAFVVVNLGGFGSVVGALIAGI